MKGRVLDVLSLSGKYFAQCPFDPLHSPKFGCEFSILADEQIVYEQRLNAPLGKAIEFFC